MTELWVSRKKKKGNLRRGARRKTQKNRVKEDHFFQGEKWSAVTNTVGKSKKIKMKNVHWKFLSDLGKNSYSGQSKSLHLP